MVGLAEGLVTELPRVGLGLESLSSDSTRYVLDPEVMLSLDSRSLRFLLLEASSSLPELSMKETFWGSMSGSSGAGTAVWRRRGGPDAGVGDDEANSRPTESPRDDWRENVGGGPEIESQSSVKSGEYLW